MRCPTAPPTTVRARLLLAATAPPGGPAGTVRGAPPRKSGPCRVRHVCDVLCRFRCTRRSPTVGGPGMGPICVAAHLGPFLPDHPVVPLRQQQPCGTVSAAPWGSAWILPISWAYVALMGPRGRWWRRPRSRSSTPTTWRGGSGAPLPAALYGSETAWSHNECIIDCRPFKASAGNRGGRHRENASSTMGYTSPHGSPFPVAGTLMIEPTESESKGGAGPLLRRADLDPPGNQRVEEGTQPRSNNLLTNAPHTLADVIADAWEPPLYARARRLPRRWTRAHKVWPSVSRGGRRLRRSEPVCVCPPMEAYALRSRLRRHAPPTLPRRWRPLRRRKHGDRRGAAPTAPPARAQASCGSTASTRLVCRWAATSPRLATNHAEIARRGLDAVRRPTGGRAVWHEHEVTYAVAAPLAAFGSLRNAYHTIHERIAAALRSLGADATSRAPATAAIRRVQAVGVLLRDSGRPARYSSPVASWWARRKVRKRSAFLQHGSILLRARSSDRCRKPQAASRKQPKPHSLEHWAGPVTS